MKQVIRMMAAVFMFSVAQIVIASDSANAELRRQLYELKALQSVVSLQVEVYNQDQTWCASGSADFVDGEATLEMDIDKGPGYYRGYASWDDKLGNQLFYSYDSKLTVFKAGVNLKDFPVYLSPWRDIQLKIDGPSNNSEVWVNGQRAWFYAGYWHVQVNEPWNLDELSIIWNGHGGWKVSVNPSYPFGDTFVLTADGMDLTLDSVSQMSAVSYSGEDSWTSGVASYVQNIDYQGKTMAEIMMSGVADGTKVVVFFSYWDERMGTTIEYFNTAVMVEPAKGYGQIILIPLTGTWFDQNRTQIRLLFQDANGKYWQTWVSAGGKG